MDGQAQGFTELLARSRAGDRSAIDEVFQRWRPLLQMQARRELAGAVAAHVDPADVVQEALTQAYETLHDFRGATEAEWVAWLQSQVAGHAAKANRRYQSQKRDVGRNEPLPEGLTASSAPGPADQILRREEALRISQALEQLPAAMRDVIVRRIFAREPFEEVARALGCSAGAARVTWTRGLRLLRDLLRDSERT